MLVTVHALEHNFGRRLWQRNLHTLDLHRWTSGSGSYYPESSITLVVGYNSFRLICFAADVRYNNSRECLLHFEFMVSD